MALRSAWTSLLACLLASACAGTASPAAATVVPAGGSSSAGPSAASVPAATSPGGPGTSVPSAGPSAGTPPSPSPPGGPTPVALPDWPVYHRDPARSGDGVAAPSLQGPLRIAWTAGLDGAVYAEPLVISGRVVAATENDTLYALDPSDGRVRWRQHLGTPVPLASLPCGDIDPLGITGTPAYDPVSGAVFAVAEVFGPRHVLYAIDPSTGAVRWSRDVDPPGSDPTVHQQRAALAVGNGIVYIGFGGLDGDCGDYQGKVVGIATDGSGPMLVYQVPVEREGGIWATGGPVLDGQGHVYVSVGNGSSTTRWDGSDSVLELSPDLRLLSSFTPAGWASDNARDLDLGSLSPVLLTNGYVLIAGKSGEAYSLRQGSLGGIGGQVASVQLCEGFGGAAFDGDTAFLPCRGGLQQVRVAPDGSIHPGWRTDSGADGPPVLAGGVAWSVATDNGELFALDETTGRTVGQIGVGAVPHFDSPTPWGDQLFVGTMHGLVSVRTMPG